MQTHLVLRGIRDQLAQQLKAIRSELETARQIQLSILPREDPRTKDLDISARYIPMTSVAGDFYDFIVVDDKRLGALVADVSGHGMPAALISSMLKIALAAQSECASDPARVLSGLNEALCGKFKGHFVTAAYIFIDLEKKTITYAGAGHPPLLLRDHSSGKGSEVLENGLFLGAFPHAAYSSLERPFQEGDMMLLYTDGIVEMNSAQEEEFGGDRLKQFLENNGELPAEKFIASLLDELTTWSTGREAEDDLTLLAIRFNN